MSSVLIRESSSALPSLPIPLTSPSPRAAEDFLTWMVPATVLSDGSGRRRHRGETLRADGRRSDQGFLAFYRQSDDSEAPAIRAMKARPSIATYLQEQAVGELAEHWVATQITYYRAGRDGSALTGGFSAATARHILGIVADLDGKRMDPMMRQLLLGDWWAFRDALEARLGALGIERYLVVRSGPDGVHIYVPILRPDGRPLRASEANLAAWERAAKGLNRQLEDMGADFNAVKATQPFAIPGIPRSKHRGFVPYVAAKRDGRAADLFALIRRMSELKLMPAAKPARVIPLPHHGADGMAAALLEEIRMKAAGVDQGGRNQVAHDIGVYLLCKGATVHEMESALTAWNERNEPPMSQKELQRCMRSAERRAQDQDEQWAEMKAAPWRRLRGLLSLDVPKVVYFHKGGRRHPLTPPKPWLERKENGREHLEEIEERLLAFVAIEGVVELTQSKIADAINACPASLKVVLKRVKASERLVVTTTRGRNGTTRLELPPIVEVSTDAPVEKGYSRIAPVGVQKGEWVGPAVSLPDQTLVEVCPAVLCSVPCPAVDIYDALAAVARSVPGLDYRASLLGSVVVVVDRGGGWLVVSRDQAGGDLLRAIELAGGREALGQLLGGFVRFVYGSGRDPRRPGGGSRSG